MRDKLFFVWATSVLFILSVSLNAFCEEIKPAEEVFKDIKYTEEAYYKTDRMLLSATKNLMESRKAPAINTVITAEDIRNMGARNLFDVLDKIPGLSTSWNQLKGLIDIRGVHTDHSEKVLLMIDGVRIRDSYTGSPTFLFGEDMMVENIKRIEVVRGPGSALYGASAFIGAINIITKDAEDFRDKNVVASASIGSFNTQNFTVQFANSKSDFKVSGHLNYLDTDGERPMIEEDALSNHPVFDTSASLAPGRAQTFDEKIDFGLKLNYNDFTLNTRIIDKERGDYAGTIGALNDDSLLDFSMGLVDLNYNTDITDDLNLSTKLYFVHMDYDAYAVLYPPGFHPVLDDNGMIGRPLFKNNVIGGELTSNYTFGDHLITSGFVYEHDRQYDVRSYDNFTDFGEPVDTTDTNNYNINVTRKIWAVFFQEMWEISAYDSLTLGVRYDHYNDFGGTTNPRIGYVHEFKNEMIVKFLYGTAFRAPNNNELYSKIGTLGNPDLEPETIETYEASFEIPFLNYFNLNISYFRNEIDDIIRMDTSDPSGPPYPFANMTEESTIDGVETELNFNFGKNRYGYINASYQNSEDSDGKDLPYVADWMGNVGYNHEFFGMLNANINLSWIGERTRLEGDTRDKAPSATLVDTTFILKNFYKGFEIKGSVFNLFDERYVAPSTITSVTNDLPLHRRMFLAEVLYRF